MQDPQIADVRAGRYAELALGPAAHAASDLPEPLGFAGGHPADQRCNVFWLVAGIEERAQWFGRKGTFYMRNLDVHGDSWKPNRLNASVGRVNVPEYWKSDVLPPAMRHDSGHGGSHTFLCNEFVNALLEDREPAVDVYESLPGIAAHQSSLMGGEQLKVPSFDRS